MIRLCRELFQLSDDLLLSGKISYRAFQRCSDPLTHTANQLLLRLLFFRQVAAFGVFSEVADPEVGNQI